MKKCSINSIETFGLADGPGIRTVIFFNGCNLRCKYCHNPEMWHLQELNTTPEELAKKIIRNKPYFTRNSGGVTFSGGEPLLQSEFIIETSKILKQENIHIALDTCGVGTGNYDEILKYVDLVLFDIKQITKEAYLDLTSHTMDESLKFIEALNRSGKKVWIRQVIVPGQMDNNTYIQGLAKFLKQIKNIENITFLPYHTLGVEKYKKLGLDYCYKNLPAMDKEECDKLFASFMKLYKEEVSR